MANEIVALAESEILLKECLFDRVQPRFQRRIESKWKIDRSYELPYQTYFIVVNPLKTFKETYTQISVLENYLRNKLKYKRILITRETNAKSIHYNVLVTTDYEINHKDTRVLNKKFCWYSQVCNHRADQERVIKYITKEDKIYKDRYDMYMYVRS